ncbi:hypothetical protein OHB56_33120 [Streptomyces sp. NBC_01635]|uniref:hypothetical protein n=1 Tax=Streptomyces sp. NBC_01635 TaxID=2975904 RepID=UPI00386384BE|nr:hypothetical protein OHB56_33120 [Streptomyces sp. NBC_01635]
MKRQNISRKAKADKVPDRTLYLIDIENMACSCDLTVSRVAQICARIRAAIEPVPGDHTVIAASHYNASAAFFGWKGGVQRLARSGKDGADAALLEVVEDTAWTAARYARVVIASGDHAFAYAVAGLKVAGCEVIVIPPDTGFSPQMRLVAGPGLVRLGPAMPDNVISLFRRNDKDAV